MKGNGRGSGGGDVKNRVLVCDRRRIGAISHGRILLELSLGFNLDDSHLTAPQSGATFSAVFVCVCAGLCVSHNDMISFTVQLHYNEHAPCSPVIRVCEMAPISD